MSATAREPEQETAQLQEEPEQPATAIQCALQEYVQETHANPTSNQEQTSAAITQELPHPAVQQTHSAHQVITTRLRPAQQHLHIVSAKQQILHIIVQYAAIVQEDLIPAAQQPVEQPTAVQEAAYVTELEQEQITA